MPTKPSNCVRVPAAALSERDDNAEVCKDKKGDIEPDSDLLEFDPAGLGVREVYVGGNFTAASSATNAKRSPRAGIEISTKPTKPRPAAAA